MDQGGQIRPACGRGEDGPAQRPVLPKRLAVVVEEAVTAGVAWAGLGANEGGHQLLSNLSGQGKASMASGAQSQSDLSFSGSSPLNCNRSSQWETALQAYAVRGIALSLDWAWATIHNAQTLKIARALTSTTPRQNTDNRPGPLAPESLADDLAKVRRYGVGQPMGSLTRHDIPALFWVATEFASDPTMAMTQRLEQVVRKGIDRMHPPETRQAVSVLLWLDDEPGSRRKRKTLKLRRKQAAALLGISPNTLERRRERSLLEELAQQLLALRPVETQVHTFREHPNTSKAVVEEFAWRACSLHYAALSGLFVIELHQQLFGDRPPTTDPYLPSKSAVTATWAGQVMEHSEKMSSLIARLIYRKSSDVSIDEVLPQSAISLIKTATGPISANRPRPFPSEDQTETTMWLGELVEVTGIVERNISAYISYERPIKSRARERAVKLLTSYYDFDDRPLHDGLSLRELVNRHFDRAAYSVD